MPADNGGSGDLNLFGMENWFNQIPTNQINQPR